MKLRAALAALSFTAALLTGASSSMAAPGKGKIGPVLSGNEYVTLTPFVVPIVEGRETVRKQFTLVLALKLAYEDAREEVLRRTPRIRDAIYPHLYRLITFRQRKPRLISKARLKQALSSIALDAAGRDLVTELVVQEAFAGDPP